MPVPKYDELFNPTLEAFRQLGGSGTNEEIEEKVVEILQLSDKDTSIMHSGSVTELGYRLAWSRNYLKRYGLLDNSARSVWSLTKKGQETKTVDVKVVNKAVKAMDRKEKALQEVDENEVIEGNLSLPWEQELLERLQTVSPSGFERLSQRLLREAGFVEVKVTGKPDDGGIDGIGTIRLNLISFKVIFQCKRYKKSITAAQIRDFKGTMMGRAERGLFITTSSFTRSAKQEANRDGSSPIDLIDGDRLVTLMKGFGLGINVEQKEVVSVNYNWFAPYQD